MSEIGKLGGAAEALLGISWGLLGLWGAAVGLDVLSSSSAGQLGVLSGFPSLSFRAFRASCLRLEKKVFSYYYVKIGKRYEN